MDKDLEQDIHDDALREITQLHKFILKEDITYLDVRLCYHEDDTYCFTFGDVAYDTHHGIACGAGGIHRNDDLEQWKITAHLLVEQVLDQLAEMDTRRRIP